MVLGPNTSAGSWPYLLPIGHRPTHHPPYPSLECLPSALCPPFSDSQAYMTEVALSYQWTCTTGLRLASSLVHVHVLASLILSWHQNSYCTFITTVIRWSLEGTCVSPGCFLNCAFRLAIVPSYCFICMMSACSRRHALSLGSPISLPMWRKHHTQLALFFQWHCRKSDLWWSSI